MTKKLRNQHHAPKWEQEEGKKNNSLLDGSSNHLLFDISTSILHVFLIYLTLATLSVDLILLHLKSKGKVAPRLN
jgi:hypothetical protein